MTKTNARRQRQIAAHSVIAGSGLVDSGVVDLENAVNGDTSDSFAPVSPSKDATLEYSQSSARTFSSVELPGKIRESAPGPSNGQQMAGHQDSLASQQPRKLQEVISSALPCQEGNEMGIRDSKWGRAALDLGIVLTFESVVDRAALGIGGPHSVVGAPPPMVVPSISRPDGAKNSCCVLS
mmetsp:Transcript_23041/g.74399  ORF Transcript_23041/g.74399 Transcript_23041/m.74399 type:complete len:181 (-) Transcript_23041:24-566(-)